MSFLRCILAAFFAILIANPACCCSTESLASLARESETCHPKCCDEKSPPLSQETPDHQACNCDAGPRGLTEQPRITIAAPEFILPPLFAIAVAFEDLTRHAAVSAPVVAPADTGPHLRRLALFQRFLI